MIKRADWVTTAYGGRGLVKRVAKDGSWADVEFKSFPHVWTKRMPATSLTVLTTIPIGNGYTVTDVTREQEVKSDA